MNNSLIFGANGGIGLAVVKQLLLQYDISKIYATYRREESAKELLSLGEENSDKLCCLKMDVTDETQIGEAIDRIKEEIKELHLVINCVGILYGENLQPEKNLRQVNSENLLQYFQVNSIASVILAKYLLPLLRHQQRSVFATISAKLGSIGDNHLGGWYGYRASKTALNMLMRTVAIEYKRSSPRTIIALLHPGTTDTQLSQPFQKNVPPEKLFTVERTANQLLEVIAKLTEADSGKFFSWDGSTLPW